MSQEEATEAVDKFNRHVRECFTCQPLWDVYCAEGVKLNDEADEQAALWLQEQTRRKRARKAT
jgi:hypothetical protein